MPDQHVTQMDGFRSAAADLPQTVWQMAPAEPGVAPEATAEQPVPVEAPVDAPPAEVAPEAPEQTPEVPTEQPAPVAAAEQE